LTADKIAKSLIFILKPAFFPLLAVIFLFNSDTYISLYTTVFQLRIYLIIFIITILFPASFIPVLFSLGIFETLKIVTKKENIIILSILAITNLITFFLLRYLPVYINSMILLVFLVSAFIFFVSIIFTMWSSICFNMLSIGSLAGFICSVSIIFAKDYFYILAAVFLVAGLIGFAKLQLQQKNQFEIYSAFVIGFAINIIFFLSILN